jgi:hypothetical protein
MLEPVAVVQILHVQQLSKRPDAHLLETFFLRDVGAAMGY